MKKAYTILISLALCAAAGAAVRAQENRAAEQAIRDALQSYSDAFSRGQAPRAGPAFVENAEYVTSDGDRIKGRQAIVKRMMGYLSTHHGDHLKLTADSILFVTPEVAQVDGNAEIRGPGGPPDVSPYTALMVRRDGRWMMQSLRDLSTEGDEEDATSAADQIKTLDWMVGDWNQQSAAGTVRATCRLDPSKSWLLWDYTVREGDKDLMTVNQRIGWDPQKGEFRSWVFDSVGGHADGDWDPADEGAWVIRQSGVLPDGGTASATCLLVPVDPTHFRWRMTERRVKGERLADVDLRFTKGAGESK